MVARRKKKKTVKAKKKSAKMPKKSKKTVKTTKKTKRTKRSNSRDRKKPATVKKSRRSAKNKRRSRKKVVFIVADGLADRMSKGKTPLAAADKPNIDWLAENGAVGELSLISKSSWEAINVKGVSQFANVNLLGYTSDRYTLARGPLEAVGAGVPYREGEVAVRCNFSTVDGNMIIKERRAGRSRLYLDEIARVINQRVRLSEKYIFMRTFGHRAVLVIKKKMPANVEGNDTEEGELVGRIMPLDDQSTETARLIQDFVDKSRDLIQYHQLNSKRIDAGVLPANYLLCRQAGNKLFTVPDFCKRWGIKKAVAIAENGVMKSTCMIAGFNAITVPEFDDHSDWLAYIFENVDSALVEYDFVYVHVKGTDEAAHDKDPKRKQKIIEEMDEYIGELISGFDGIVVLTCDHITSSETGMHEWGKVPVVVYGKGKDNVKTFSEKSAKKGSLGTMSGRELLKYIYDK